uniref:LacI family DNA-binding transcriptional regulator n=1 Tax=Gemmiger formicilis TaxID=745368 RepID=UPI004026A9B2
MPPLPKNDKPIDITQIAQALGVSKTTVSGSISGNGRISAATRQRVLDYVKAHNYTPSMMARGQVKHCSYNISLVISTQFSDFELPFLRKVMRSVYQVAGDSDYDVLLTLVGENETRPVERLLDNRKIDGLILTRTLERDPLIPLLKARKVPFVAIGQPEDDQVLSVDHNQVGGCREMTSLLLMKGMKHIALLGGSMLYTVNQSRLEGFRQAYVKMGQKIDESLLFLELESDDLRMEAVQQAVERGADCILCMDERLAQLTLNMLKQLNLRVPQDIRLASLYDNENLVNTVPPITAVQFNADILGLKATQQLLCALQGHPVETRMELGYQVSLRESTQT